MRPEAAGPICQLAADLGISVEEAVERAVNGALLLRWLTLNVGSPMPGERA